MQLQNYPSIHGYKVESVFKDTNSSLLFQVYDSDDQLRLIKVAKNHEENNEHVILPKFNHANILSVVQVFENPTAMMLPFIHSRSLNEYLKDTAPTFEILKGLFLQLIEGVEYIHAMGFLHGDIRCENILMDFKHHLTIIDFAHASPIQNPRQKITTNTSLELLAPEIQKDALWSIQSDIYGLGMVLDTLISHCTDKESIPPHWYKVCLDCRSPDPQDRPAGIRGLKNKLHSPSEQSELFDIPKYIGIEPENTIVDRKWIFLGGLMIFVGIFLGLIIAS